MSNTPEAVTTQGGDPADVPPAAPPVPTQLPADTPGFDPNAPSHPVDPEIAERQERIADLEDEIRLAEIENRRKLIADEKALTIAMLDDQEEALRAQLARVRGEKPTEE